MKLHHTLIALAVLSLGTAQAAQLAPADAAAAATIYASGSSALRFSLAAGFLEACDLTTVAVFGNTNGSSAPGNNVRAYACKLSKDIKPSAAGSATAFTAGTNVVFTKYDAGGSINGIQPLVKGTALSYLNFGSCTSTGLVRSGTFNLTQIDYACAQGNNVVPQIGVSDVEANLIQNKTNLLTGVTPVATSTLAGGKHSVAMAGVAVNVLLYRALQAAQGLAQDDTQANAPSIPVGFLAAVESGNASPLAGTGFNALIASDNTASTTDSSAQAVQFCSRQNGSGTKAMHSAFLLNAPCSSNGFTPVGGNSNSATPVDNGDSVLQLNSSTGNVIACLQTANANPSTAMTSDGHFKQWAIGLIGSENDPAAGTGTDAHWRFVKVSGAYPSQANAQIGAYPMTYENYLYYPTSLTGSALNFAKWLQSDAVTPIALSHVPDVGTQNGILSIADITNPAYAAVTNFVARTTRDATSCKPQYLYQ